MTENNDSVWDYDDLRVNDEGMVEGTAISREFAGGHTVQASVSSYEFEFDGETRVNHVPHIVVQDENGSIVSEPTDNDTTSPKKAIERAKGTGEYVVRNPDDFI